MELWTDDSESQFAIIANSQVLAKTNDGIFTKKLDSTSFNRNDNYDWDSVIRRWIHFYFLNKYSCTIVIGRKLPPIKFIPMNSVKSRPRLRIKCTFCGLKFYSDPHREEHEKVWHSDKLKKE